MVAGLVAPSENDTTDDVVTVGISVDADGAIRDVPVRLGEDVGLLGSTTEDPPTSAGEELGVATDVLVDDAEDDGFQLVLEAEANGDQQLEDKVGIAPVLTDAIGNVVAVKAVIGS